MELVLHIGSGKLNVVKELYEQDKINVYLDRSYKGIINSIQEIEHNFHSIQQKNNSLTAHIYNNYSNLDVFEFMDSFKFKFTHIEAYRIFEHMDYCSGEIGRLLEACNMITTDNATMDIIVPNSVLISQMILDVEANYDNLKHEELLNKILVINTENQNCKYADPHGSTWTPVLAKLYIGQEQTWIINEIIPSIMYAKRNNVYMRILCSK